jgi:hypothetical protein
MLKQNNKIYAKISSNSPTVPVTVPAQNKAPVQFIYTMSTGTRPVFEKELRQISVS